MKLIRQIGAWFLIAGLLVFFPCGGMHMKHDAEGTWLRIGPLQWIAGAVLALGVVLAVAGAFIGNKPKP